MRGRGGRGGRGGEGGGGGGRQGELDFGDRRIGLSGSAAGPIKLARFFCFPDLCHLLDRSRPVRLLGTRVIYGDVLGQSATSWKRQVYLDGQTILLRL